MGDSGQFDYGGDIPSNPAWGATPGGGADMSGTQGLDPGTQNLGEDPIGGGADSSGTFSLDNLGGGVSTNPDDILAGLNIGGNNGISLSGPNLGIMPIGAPRNALSAIVRIASAALGMHVSIRQIAALLKTYGPAALRLLNLSPQQAMQVTVRKGHRRSRGITGRQLANAARVANKLARMTATFRRAIGHGYGQQRHAAPPRYAFHHRRRKK